VALLHYTSPPVVGGVESVLGHQARHLAAHGWEVRVLTGRGGRLGGSVHVHRIPLLDSRHRRVLRVTRDLEQGRIPPEFSVLSAEIQEALARALESIDVVVVHNALVLHKNLALTAALHRLARERRPPRLIAWCHDLASANPQYRPHLHPGEPWALLETAIARATYVAVSRDRRAALGASLGLPESEIDVIPNGIDPAGFLHLTPTGRRLAEALGLWDQQIVLLLPVRITRRKRIEYALHVASELARRELSVRVLVTGPLGPHTPHNREYLEELRQVRRRLGVEKQVVFFTDLRGPGGRRIALSPRVMADLYLLADALLLPSREEGFGLPLLEAALARLPAFTTGLGPLREIAGDTIDMFGVNDPPATCAQQIVRTLMDDGRYRLRRRVLGAYTWGGIMRYRVIPLLTPRAPASSP
jgi:glycosyltransferase involved in cell wall biosynthesis